MFAYIVRLLKTLYMFLDGIDSIILVKVKVIIFFLTGFIRTLLRLLFLKEIVLGIDQVFDEKFEVSDRSCEFIPDLFSWE